jgi:quinoprotein relay system zinc metallohydrolase 2
MFELIMTACLAASSQTCGPILLPAGRAETFDECAASKARIGALWITTHPTLLGVKLDCLASADLPVLDLKRGAEGVYYSLGQPVQLEGSPDGRIANLGVVIGQTVAVIDSGASRAQGQELYAAIRRLTDRPISHVILTHMHPDHVLGTQVFVEAGAKVVGHRALGPALEMRAQTYLDNMRRLYGDRTMLGTEITFPDILVDDRMEVDLGGRKLTVIAARTAHTDNDLTVLDDETGVLFAGDLIFRRLTPVVDGSLTGWLEWQSTMPEPAPRLIVPGHGDVAGSWSEAVTAQNTFLNALAQSTRARIAEGEPMSEAVPLIVGDLASFASEWSAFPETAARNATAAYKELEWQ